MFAYNTLSDLKNGDLVTPLRKDGDSIICLNSAGEEVSYSFDDFDFDKTEEERLFVVDDDLVSDETSTDEIVSDTEEDQGEIIEEIPEESNDGEIVSDEEQTAATTTGKTSYFIEDKATKISLMSSYGMKYKDINKVNIWVDEVN